MQLYICKFCNLKSLVSHLYCLLYFITITEYAEKGDFILKSVYLAHNSTDSGSANNQVVDEIIMTRTHVKKEIISPDGKEESLRTLNPFQYQTSEHLIVYTS